MVFVSSILDPATYKCPGWTLCKMNHPKRAITLHLGGEGSIFTHTSVGKIAILMTCKDTQGKCHMFVKSSLVMAGGR